MPEDLRPLFDQAVAAIEPYLGPNCMISVEHEIMRYGSGNVKACWSVVATPAYAKASWIFGVESDTFEESLADLVKQLLDKDLADFSKKG